MSEATKKREAQGRRQSPMSARGSFGLTHCNKFEAISKLIFRRAVLPAAPSPPSDRACRSLP